MQNQPQLPLEQELEAKKAQLLSLYNLVQNLQNIMAAQIGTIMSDPSTTMATLRAATDELNESDMSRLLKLSELTGSYKATNIILKHFKNI